MNRMFSILVLVCLLIGMNVRLAALPGTVQSQSDKPAAKGRAAAVTGVAVSPNGQIAAAAYDNFVVKFWEIASGRELEPYLPGTKTYPVTAIAFVPDPGAHSSIGNFSSSYFESTKSGARVGLRCARQGDVLVYSRDGKKAAIGGSDGATSVVDVETGKPVAVLKALPTAVTAVAFTGDDEVMTASGTDLRRWRISDGSLVETLVLGRADSSVGVAKILAFSADATHAACAEADGSVSLWELTAGRRIRTLKNDGTPVTKLAVTPDGRGIIAVGADFKIRVLDTSGEVAARLFGETASSVGDTSIGISECDEYLRLYEKCMNNPKFPESARAMMKTSLETTRKAWRDALEKARNSPGEDAVLKATTDACKQAAMALKSNSFCK